MTDKSAEIGAKLDSYDPAADQYAIDKGVDERRSILDRFPLESWPELELTRYAVGQENSDDTYCRYVEFASPNLGSIKGGSSQKLLIYKYKEQPGWHYDESAFSSVEEAWQAVRAAFVRAFELAANDEFDAIDELPELQPGRALLNKSLHIYFPDQVLPIGAASHLQHFLGLLGHDESKIKQLSALKLNRMLLAELRVIDRHGHSTNQLQRILYRYFAPPSTTSWWKISPGAGATYWNQFLEKGICAVGWSEMGDLTEFTSQEEYLEAFRRAYAHEGKSPSAVKAKASELWRFYELKAGDRIVANRGKSEIVGLGEVIEPYSYDPENEPYHHVVRVKWDESYAMPVPFQGGWNRTVDKVSSEIRDLLKTRDGAGVTEPPDVDPLYLQMEKALTAKRQLILQGPPGTGKTYHARRFAAWFLAKKASEPGAESVFESPEALTEAEQRLNRDSTGQWNLVTFHSSYSYEDFVEGFRPAIGTGGNASLELEDGLFKRLCAAARANPDKPHLLIIDEINRANLSKVFGELFTLLEKDKRGLGLTLPQSKESFEIPSNVYLVGTMNTADRSIAPIDLALRRRFAFLPVNPDPEVISQTVGALSLGPFLEELNRSIAEVVGSEKQIGHSFFMDGDKPIASPDDFLSVFHQEIVPLLQEYCFGEMESLLAILGADLIDPDSLEFKESTIEDPDALLLTLATRFSASSVET